MIGFPGSLAAVAGLRNISEGRSVDLSSNTIIKIEELKQTRGEEGFLRGCQQSQSVIFAEITSASQLLTSHTASHVEMIFYGCYLAVEAICGRSDVGLGAGRQARPQTLDGRTTISPPSCFINDVLGPSQKLCR